MPETTEPNGAPAVEPRPSPLRRFFTRRNLIIGAIVLIVFDIALTHYLFNSKQRNLFLHNLITATKEGGREMTLADFTSFEWTRVHVRPLTKGSEFWFSTYDSRTYLFDHIFTFDDGEVVVTALSGTVYEPGDMFTVRRENASIRLTPKP